MKTYLKNIVISCFTYLWLYSPVHAADEIREEMLLAKADSTRLLENPPAQSPYIDELWLLGTFLVSLLGIFILGRFLDRKQK